MDHTSDIAAIDPHAKCHRRDYDIQALTREVFLRSAACAGFHAGMIVGHSQAPRSEPACQFLGLPPAEAVDNGASTRVTL